VSNRTDINVVFSFFQKNVPELYSIVSKIDFNEWFENEIFDENDIFKTLCRTIVGQQLAGKAANAIFLRFDSLLLGNITPENILLTEPEQIREVGLSWAKVRSVVDLSTRVVNKELILGNLEEMNDEDLIEELSKVKGIGRWTAEMFLMFQLGREDIFSWGDLGLKNGLKKFLGKPEVTIPEMEEVVTKWKPYRTYGAIALWHLLDNR